MPLLKYSQHFRDAASYTYSVKVKNGSVEDAKCWATSHTKGECTYIGWHGHVTFYFDDMNDALMFKLAYG